MHRATGNLAMASEREAVSRGAALIAGVAAGWWDAEEYPPADVVDMTGTTFVPGATSAARS